MKADPFTIKWITNDGITHLFSASSVSTGIDYTKPVAVSRGIASAPDWIEYRDAANDVPGTIDSGVVYVMNGSGRTVDTYHLPISNDEVSTEEPEVLTA